MSKAKLEIVADVRALKVAKLDVEVLYMHQALQVSGLPAERTLSDTKFKGIKFYWSDVFDYVCECQGRVFSIPKPNVADIVFTKGTSLEIV
jgi:hypothetical protein